ncbi:mid1-interacting protein 1-like [Pogona vitticeps]
MEGYFSAVQKMEQTVMFPSLLLGVSMEDQGDDVNGNSTDRDSSDRDLYEYYILLKSIKLTAEGGLGLLKDKSLHLREDEVKEEKDDLEGLFRHHVSSLCHVLTELTRRANAVTSKYNEIMGQINQNEMALRW